MRAPRSSSRLLAVLTLLAAALPAAVVAVDATALRAGDQRSTKPMRCEPPTFGRDKLSVVCTLDPSAPQAVHVKIHFTGSHDDTTASIAVALGDAPVACDDGSKTSTEAEDGDVTLDCRFTAPGGAGAATLLRVSSQWFHAQYVSLEVNAP